MWSTAGVLSFGVERGSASSSLGGSVGHRQSVGGDMRSTTNGCLELDLVVSVAGALKRASRVRFGLDQPFVDEELDDVLDRWTEPPTTDRKM